MPNSQVNPNSASNYRGLGALESFNVILKNSTNDSFVDITALVVDFSIYEDIFSKTLYGDVTIKDAVNLLNGDQQQDSLVGFPIVGEEFIEVFYSVSGQESVSRRFAVYSIKNISIDHSLKVRNYVLSFCSEEHLIDSTTLVQKGYIDNISNMAKDVLENYLKVNEGVEGGKRKKIYRIQPTRGQQQIVIPKLTPLEALDLLARRSIAEKYFTSATYLFFENKDGFNFCDIEYLIQAGRQKYVKDDKTFTYYYQNPLREDRHEDTGLAYKNVIRLTQKSKFDTIEKLRRGYFESEAIVVDFATKKISSTLYKFSDKYTTFLTMGDPTKGNPSYPENSLDFIKNVTKQESVNPNKLFGIFNFRQTVPDAGRHSKSFLIPTDGSSKYKPALDEIYTNRASYMTRLAQNMYTADVYGDTQIGAGDLIRIDLPEIVGTTEERHYDKYLSGYFLVTSIHHKFTPDSYHCTYDMFKNGYSEAVITRDTDERPTPTNPISITTELDVITNAGS